MHVLAWFIELKGQTVRYKAVEGTKVHESDDCLVIIAEDVKRKRKVALKLMANETQWEREKSTRRTESGVAIDGSHIVEILDIHEDMRAKSLSSGFPHVLAMPAAIHGRVRPCSFASFLASSNATLASAIVSFCCTILIELLLCC